MSKIERSTSLSYTGGGSDKVYNASIVEVTGGYEVHYSYGRRGNSLTHGKKTIAPTNLLAAEKIYNSLVTAKSRKGYVTTGSSTPVAAAAVFEERDTGVRPQLLNEIPEEDLERYIECPHWCAQEKYDGRRRLFVKTADVIIPTNRKGLSVSINEKFIEDLRDYTPESVILDSEDMGFEMRVFDYLVTGKTYSQRYNMLCNMFAGYDNDLFRIVETAWNTDEKRALLAKLRAGNAEGIVFKKVESLYVPGRPNSGGDQVKFKFYATATCFVREVSTTKRSVSLAMYRDSSLHDVVGVGNCTVYPNMDIPKLGELVEIKYLYAYKGGSLYQPVLLGVRDDLNIEDCQISQLKYKRDD